MVLLSTCIARKCYYKRASGSLVAASRDQSYREITCIAFGTLPFGTDTVTSPSLSYINYIKHQKLYINQLNKQIVHMKKIERLNRIQIEKHWRNRDRYRVHFSGIEAV